jgi:hypothetical protein
MPLFGLSVNHLTREGDPIVFSTVGTNRVRYIYNSCTYICTVKAAHTVTSNKQSPVFKGHIFLILS